MAQNKVWATTCRLDKIQTNNNLGRISHRFRDIPSFPLKNAQFYNPHPFKPKF